MLLKYHLNEFDSEPSCPKCLHDGCMQIRYCKGDAVVRSGESLIPVTLPTEPEKPYCSIFIIPHLDWACARCGFAWYSATADQSKAIVDRVNLVVRARRKKQVETEWPEVIGAGAM